MDDGKLAELLVGAITSLPEADRETTLVELVRRGIAPHPGWAAPRGAVEVPWRRGSWSGLPDDLTAGAPASGDRRNVLVRLDQSQHERLKTWCRSHDFTMATVLRGLVDRFLETQAAPPDEVRPDELAPDDIVAGGPPAG